MAIRGDWTWRTGRGYGRDDNAGNGTAAGASRAGPGESADAGRADLLDRLPGPGGAGCVRRLRTGTGRRGAQRPGGVGQDRLPGRLCGRAGHQHRSGRPHVLGRHAGRRGRDRPDDARRRRCRRASVFPGPGWTHCQVCRDPLLREPDAPGARQVRSCAAVRKTTPASAPRPAKEPRSSPWRARSKTRDWSRSPWGPRCARL